MFSFPIYQSFRKFIFPRARMDLFDLLEFHGGPLPLCTTIHVLRSIASALEACHCMARLAHLDVKPENILLDDDGTVKLTDFGFSKSEASMSQSMMSLYGKPLHVGTKAYMPPEVETPIHGMADLYPRDIWALGAVMVNVLTGKDCFSDTESRVWMNCEMRRAPCVVQDLRFLMLQDRPLNRVTSSELVLHLNSIPYGRKEDVTIIFEIKQEYE